MLCCGLLRPKAARLVVVTYLWVYSSSRVVPCVGVHESVHLFCDPSLAMFLKEPLNIPMLVRFVSSLTSLISRALLQNQSPNSFFRDISPFPQLIYEIHFSPRQRCDARMRIERIMPSEAHSLNVGPMCSAIFEWYIPPVFHTTLCLKPFQFGDDGYHRDVRAPNCLSNVTHDPGNDRRLLFPKTIYEQVDSLFLAYLTYCLEGGRVRGFPNKPRHLVQAELFFGSRKCHGRIRLELGRLGDGLGAWVDITDGESDDEVDERADANPGTTEDHDDVWFSALDARQLSKNGGENG